jgi:hypothetical protein
VQRAARRRAPDDERHSPDSDARARNEGTASCTETRETQRTRPVVEYRSVAKITDELFGRRCSKPAAPSDEPHVMLQQLQCELVTGQSNAAQMGER